MAGYDVPERALHLESKEMCSILAPERQVAARSVPVRQANTAMCTWSIYQ